MFKKKLLVALISGVTCLSALSAKASELSYTNVTVGYSALEASGEDFSGYELRGSLQVGDGVYIYGSTNDFTSDDNIAGKERDLSISELGGGVFIPISETMDVDANIGYINQDGDDAVSLGDGEGFTVGVGIRALVGSSFEVGGGLRHINLEEDDSTGIDVYGRYFLRSAVSVGASYADTDDLEGFNLDVRIDF